VVVVHFGSQRADPPMFGRFQPPGHPSRTQRIEQAREVAEFVGEILARDPGAFVLVAGDLNDVETSAPVSILEQGGLSDLMRTVPDEDRYTEIFEGGAQALDHILVSESLARRVTAIAAAHVNADFPNQASDHDPVVVRFAVEKTQASRGWTCSVCLSSRAGCKALLLLGVLAGVRRRKWRSRIRPILVSRTVL
jgi:predicted extracellular nuclease